MGGVTSGIGLFLSAALTGRLMDEARQEAPMIKMFTDDFVTCGDNLYFGGKKKPHHKVKNCTELTDKLRYSLLPCCFLPYIKQIFGVNPQKKLKITESVIEPCICTNSCTPSNVHSKVADVLLNRLVFALMDSI